MNSLLIADPDAKSAFLAKRPGFAEVMSAYQQKNYAEGEAAFYDYFLAKIRDISKYGIDPGRLTSFVGTYASGLKPEDVLPVADKLMADTMSLGHKDVVIGEPGAVNWNYPFGPDEAVPWDQEVDPNLSSGCGLIPLVAAYMQTHDEKYIKKWVAYMDDWAINSHYVSRVHPLMEPDNVYNQGNEEPIDVAVILLALETVSPENAKSATSVLPPRIFAEICNKYLGELQLPAIMYARSNTHNWTPRWQRVLTGCLFDEFKMGPICLREAMRRQVEDNAVTQNLRDGSENQQDQWYNFVYGDSISQALRIVERRHDAGLWTDPNFYRWESEMRAHLEDRVTYEIHMRTPGNTWPTVLAATDKRQAFLPPLAVSPDAFSDPTNFAILQATQQPESGVRPAYTSDWFPYGGYNIVRTSWGKDSSTGSLFCSPQPGAYGGYRSRSNNNMFGLEAWGQDLFIDDATGHYMYPSGPITVDGHEQFFHAGIYKVGKPSPHKVYEVSAWTEPANWRWHSSESFNLMEGIYKGPYADPPDSPSIIGPYGLDQSQGNTRPLEGTIQDFTHQRLVLYMHGANLWIITDRMLTQASHQYVQKWQIPITPAAHTAFELGEVKFDGQLSHYYHGRAEEGQFFDVSIHQLATSIFE